MNHLIKHLILTPFNFNFFGIGVDPLTDEWMERRLQIFMDVTYPSLMSQTIMDFEWIVGFDCKTSAKWKEKIGNLRNIIPVYPEKPRKIWTDIAKSYINNCKYFLTTRIDNDDAFTDNAIETIQFMAYEGQPRYINLLHGLVTDGKVTYLLAYKSNSFMSRLEKSSNAESVRAIDHTVAIGTKHFQQVKNTPPMWLIYIHDLNYRWKMETALKGLLRRHVVAPSDALDSFSINL